MNQEELTAVRHSLAHVLAAATKRVFGDDVKLGVGPAVSDGFYYDMDLGDKKLVEEDLTRLEKMMRKIIAEGQDFTCTKKTVAEAKDWAKAQHQPYKLELIEDFAAKGTTRVKGKAESADHDHMTFYTNGDFTDLCRGGHVKNTHDIPADGFKLTKIAGAYWRGDETRPMMQRVYGVAFATKDDLDAYLKRQAEAKERDHRKLGRELDLYVTSDLVGTGLPIFTQRGTVLREELAKVSNELREDMGFMKVWTPNMTKKDLYEKSGHWAKFGDELFLVKSQETTDQFVLKPMNCPHHTRIFTSKVRSYRDMPQRYLETTTCYRDEKSGELGGLSRVRALTQDDSHDFVRPDQIESEIANLLDAVKKLYKLVGMKLRVRLSYRDDSDHYLGPQSLWDSAQAQLKAAVLKLGIDYYEQEGEAAFYGPKIDFMATDALGREHQLATAQLDFVQPERFELEYTTEDGGTARPVMIHCALLGSIERFLSVYIEHTAGKFPVWCAPEQLRIVKVKSTPAIDALLDKLVKALKSYRLRYTIDDSNNTIGKKIRAAVAYKVPYVVVLGEREAETGQLGVRIREDLVGEGTKPDATFTVDELATKLDAEHRNRTEFSTL